MTEVYGLTSTGFNRKRLVEVQEEIEAAFVDAFGASLDLGAETPEGQLIANLSAMFAELWEVAEDSFNALDPNSALDVALDRICAYNLITRQKASRTAVDLLVTGTEGTIIPAGSIVEHNKSGEHFVTAERMVISGDTIIPAESENTGPIVAAAGSLTLPFTVISGWDTVTNPEAGVVGQNQETNEELRIRRDQSTAVNTLNIAESLKAQLQALDNVNSVSVIDNDTPAVVNGTAANSAEAIVSGGLEEDIAEVLLLNKIPGVRYFGNTEIANQVDSEGTPVYIAYTTPVEVPIQVQVTLIKDGEYPATGDDDIAQNIIDYAAGILIDDRGFFVGDSVLLTRLYTPINLVDGHYISDLQISRVGDTLAESNIDISIREIATFSAANITVI